MSGANHLRTDPAALAYVYYRDASPMFRLIARGRPYICPFEPIVQWVPPSSRILDIGCGCGLWLIALANINRIESGTGCDTNQGALKIARQAASRLATQNSSPPLTFNHTPAISDWPTGQFDAVSLIDVMHHIPAETQSVFLAAAWQHVRPGGRLIYKDMASKPKLHALANRLHDLAMARQIISYLPLDAVADQLANLDGTVLHREAWRRGVYAHELLIVEKTK